MDQLIMDKPKKCSYGRIEGHHRANDHFANNLFIFNFNKFTFQCSILLS